MHQTFGAQFLAESESVHGGRTMVYLGNGWYYDTADDCYYTI